MDYVDYIFAFVIVLIISGFVAEIAMKLDKCKFCGLPIIEHSIRLLRQCVDGMERQRRLDIQQLLQDSEREALEAQLRER